MTRRRTLLVAWAHLLVLWSFAFAQPLFHLLSDNPEFFVARGNTRLDIIVLAVALTLVPPTVLAAVEALAFLLGPTVRLGVHLTFVAVLVAVIALQVLDGLTISAALLILAAGLVGAAIAVVYARAEVVRSVLTALIPAPFVFVTIFLFFSPVSDLVFANETRADAGVVGRPTPVVVVVFDEFSGASLMDRRYRIDATRYPNFATLARGATWYRNATTVANSTPQGVPSILTGERPRPGKLPIAADQPRSIFSLLGKQYSFHVVEPITDICPERLCGRESRKSTDSRWESLISDLSIVSLHLTLPDDLRDDLPAVNRSFEGFGNHVDDGDAGRPAAVARLARDNSHQLALALRGQQFLNFVAQIQAAEKPSTLHLLHIVLPHIPWNYLPSGQGYPVGANGGSGVFASDNMPGLSADNNWSHDRSLVRQGFERYMLQVAFVDKLLGLLVARLRETGLYDRSLLVVTADHGVGFHPGGYRRRMTSGNVGEMAGVPLFIKAPGQSRGRIDDTAVRSIDILPTIADYLDTRLPWKSEGRSLLAHNQPAVDRLRIDSLVGPPLRLPFSTYVRRRNAEVAYIASLFGSDNGRRGLFGGGPDADLLGRDVSALRPTAPTDASVDLDVKDLLGAVDPTASEVPAYIIGKITGGGGRAGERLAVAVNGRVRALAETRQAGGDVRLDAMIPPESLHGGANAVEVFAIRGAGAGRRYSNLGGVRPDIAGYRLVDAGDHPALVTRTGERIEISRDAVHGNVEGLHITGRVLELQGWSVAEGGRPSSAVAAFLDDHLIAVGHPSVARPDVAKSFGQSALKSGFFLNGAVRPSGDVAARVRVFGISHGRASELRHSEQH